METPYYKGVPKNKKDNLKWRKEVIQKAGNDDEYAATARQMCAEDILFYINVFCWIKEPRDMDEPIKPFITYGYQDDAILELCDGIRDGFSIAWPKTRTMGATWMGVTVFEWFWHFYKNLEFGMVSRKESLVDEQGDVKSLFGKIDFLHDYQPNWLKPKKYRKHLQLKNEELKSIITGETTTGNIYRGARLTALFVDELSAFDVSEGYKTLNSIFDVSNCKLYPSTPQGMNNAFAEIVHNSATINRYLHFSEHPEYNKGLYTTDKKGNVKLLGDFEGTVKIRRIDWEGYREFKFPDDYPFILDGKQRSPWYDDTEAEIGSKQTMAQEVDIDFLGSDFQFFDSDFIKKLKAEYCIEPVCEGEVIFDAEEDDPDTVQPGEFSTMPGGPLKLWFNGEDKNGEAFIRDKKFGVGADVSAGTGASNSCATVVEVETGRKVALWKDPNTYPEDFAAICVALAKWFNGAKLIWDASGAVGQTFSNRISSIGYRKLYYHQDEADPGKKVSSKAGYFLNPTARGVVLREYRSSLSRRDFINVSKTGMDETLQFIQEPGGKAVHSAAKNSQDPSGAREAHGDEVISDALACHLVKSKASNDEEEEKEMDPNCVAAKLQQWQEEQEEVVEYW